jgi:hypothetical protein
MDEMDHGNEEYLIVKIKKKSAAVCAAPGSIEVLMMNLASLLISLVYRHDLEDNTIVLAVHGLV